MRRMILVFLGLISFSRPAYGDLFGGDIVILTQILAQAIQTVTQLRAILDTGGDTLNLLQDINSGIRSGLDRVRILNPKFDPGVYGGLNTADSVLSALEGVYGKNPDGPDRELIESQDRSVAEVISMNRNLYDFADQVDRERERILFHAQVVSPQGAGKLQNQALGVLIGVTTQLLRTQSQMLKLLAQNMAHETRREKLSTQNFKDNYEALSKGLKGFDHQPELPRLWSGP